MDKNIPDDRGPVNKGRHFKDVLAGAIFAANNGEVGEAIRCLALAIEELDRPPVPPAQKANRTPVTWDPVLVRVGNRRLERRTR